MFPAGQNIYNKRKRKKVYHKMSETLVSALNMLWKGMLGLFIVMGLIAVMVYFLGKIRDKNPKE